MGARIITAFIVVLFATCLLFAKTHTDYDATANFYKFKTFAWTEKPEMEDPLMQDRLINAVSRELVFRGLHEVNAGADLDIKATFSTQEKQIVYTYYDGGWAGGPGWGWWGGPGWSTTTVSTYYEGTIVVNLVDTASQKVVWRGVSTKTIPDKPVKAKEKLEKSISKMFETYPPATLRISE